MPGAEHQESTDVNWSIVVRVEHSGWGVTLAVGDVASRSAPSSLLAKFPKLLYAEVKTRGGKCDSLTLSALLTLLSSFSLYLSMDPREAVGRVRVTKAGLQQALLALSLSPVTSYRFVVVSRTKEAEEHTIPHVIGWLHRRLKSMIIPVESEPSNPLCGAVIVEREDPVEALLIALGVAGLLTVPTRHGLELRRVVAQTLVSLAAALSKARRETSERALRMVAALIADTYTWYARHAKALLDVYPAELRRLAVELPVGSGHGSPADICSRLYERLCSAILGSGSLHERVQSAVTAIQEELVPLTGEGGSEVLLGRLKGVIRAMSRWKGRSVRCVATVATGQWGIAYPLLFRDLLGAEEAYVVYTQNTLEQRLLEEYVRGVVVREGAVPQQSLAEPHYVLSSATDALLIDYVTEYVVGLLARERGESLVVAQGPATLALPLYLKARRRGIQALLI